MKPGLAIRGPDGARIAVCGKCGWVWLWFREDATRTDLCAKCEAMESADAGKPN